MMLDAVTLTVAAALAQAPPPAEPQYAPPQKPEADESPQSILPPETPSLGVQPSAALDFTPAIAEARQGLADAGIVFNLNLTLDSGWNFTGGATAGGFVSGLVTATAQLDMEKLVKLKGGSFLVSWQDFFTTNPGAYDRVPDYWGYESIDSALGNINQLSQCYYSQSLLDGALVVSFGKQDALNSFLNPLGATGYFISNMDCYPATMIPYTPTYPDQAMGLVIVGKPADWLELKTAWFDGSNAYPAGGIPPPSTGSLGPGTFFDNPGSWFFLNEIDVSWKCDGGLDGSASIGGWWQSGQTSVFVPNGPAVPRISDGTGGLYAQVTQRIYNPDPTAQTARGVRLFAQFGWGDPSSNPANWSLAGGFAWDGPLPGRDADSFGIAAGYAGLSSDPGVYQSQTGLYNLNVEAYYAIALTDWMTLQPDLQIIVSPEGSSEMPVAVVGMLRASINF